MGAEVEVSPALLEWAIGMSRRNVGDFDKNFKHLKEWLEQKKKPTIAQLQDFASFCHVPFAYLLLQEPPVETTVELPDFRTQNNAKVNINKCSPELRDTILDMKRRKDWLREYRINNIYDPIEAVGCISQSTPVSAVVNRIYKFLKINTSWRTNLTTKDDVFRYLIGKIEASGICVFVNGVVGFNNNRKLNVKEFRGFALVDNYAPVIFVNGSDAPAGKIFTLLHELVHIMLGQSTITTREEPFCNRVAAAFLVPQNEFVIAYNENKRKPGLWDNLEHTFKVSKLVLFRVAYTYGCIDESSYRELTSTYEKKYRNSGSGGSFWVNWDYKNSKTFSASVINAAKSGELLYWDAYKLLNIKKHSTFAKAAEQAGVDL